MVSEAERTAWQQVRYDRAMAVTAPRSPRLCGAEWVCNDPDLATAWVFDRFMSITETAATGRRRLDGEVAKISGVVA
ncbi:Importin subunit beta-1 [Hordeum vulgare]|nr:Importin subunit beta-1 [Hordeum vulgare]